MIFITPLYAVQIQKKEGAIKKVQFRETGSIGYRKHKMKTKQKNTTKYVFDTTICKQTQKNVNKT